MWRMTIFTVFFRCLSCKYWICRPCCKTKIYGLDRFHGNGPYCKILTEKEPMRAQGLGLPYNNSIYSLSDLGVSSNLIGSLSRSKWASFTPCGVNNAWSKQNEVAGVNSRFATISEAEILKIQEDAVPENTKKATKSGRIFTSPLRGSVNILLLFTSISKNNWNNYVCAVHYME